MDKRVGLLGGSFNPVHNGHLIIARAVAETLGLDRVILLPTKQPPHKRAGSLIDAEHRIAMVQLAIEGEPLFEFSDVDASRAAPTYTIDTIAHIRGELGLDTELYWIIGGDSLAELAAWYRAGELVDACHIVTALRPGTDTIDFTNAALTAVFTSEQIARLQQGILETPMIDISSTQVRRRCEAKQSIRYLVPDEVRKYINHNDLYQ